MANVRITMNIYDPENLIPDTAHLLGIIASHPFDGQLINKINKITIRRSERLGIAQENIKTDIDKGFVILGIGECTHSKTNYDFILYHEFSHVADIMCPEFGYSEKLKSSLSGTECICVMELWNVYINSRLNSYDLYRPSGSDCLGTLNGVRQKFPGTTEGELMAHKATLEREGFSYDQANVIIQRIWKNSRELWTYSEIIKTVKDIFANKRIQTDAAEPAPLMRAIQQ